MADGLRRRHRAARGRARRFEDNRAHALLVLAAAALASGLVACRATRVQSTPGVRWIGRVDASDPHAVRFAWSASGLVARTVGTSISALLGTEGQAAVFVQPVVDGVPGGRVEVPAGPMRTVLLASDLGPGNHVLELYRETEGSFGATVFGGLLESAPTAPPPPSGRLIEVVGDSISAGYGNLGHESHPPFSSQCTFSPETESAYRSYGAVAARALGAEVSIVARSGWGMLRDFAGNTTHVLPAIYGNALGATPAPAWSFSRQADAVLVNLGTNDSSPRAGGDPGAPFEAAYVAFLHRVRERYPSAWIFLAIGPMTSGPTLTAMRAHLTHVVATMADSKVTTIDIPPQDPASTGCDFHPSAAEDALMADLVVQAIRAQLRW
jgi:lysophospholipase L1-like esterase